MPTRRLLHGALGTTLLALIACGDASSRRASPAQGTSSAVVASQAAPLAVAPPPAPVASSGRSRYPIVLVHGIFGYRRLGTREYFNGVERHLVALGYEVHVVAVPPLAAVEVRAASLRDQLLRRYPDSSMRVNIIAHSMGGLDARAMIARHGMASRVASVSMLSTPNRGSHVADVAVGLTPGNLQQAVDQLLNVVGLDWDGIADLTTPRCAAFNLVTPDDPGVVYQSWGATADPSGRSGARLQPLLWPSWAVVFGLGGDNDGVVTPGSARWGQFQGVLPTDHVGLLGHRAPAFDHLRFYADLAEGLVAQGL